MAKSRQDVGRALLPSGKAPCVDCLALGQQRAGQGRPPRCSVHRRGYRAWYQRKWRFEQRHGTDSYPQPYEPVWYLPSTASVTVAVAEVETLESAVVTLNTSIISGLAHVRLRASKEDQASLTEYIAELAQIAEELAAVSKRLRGARRP